MIITDSRPNKRKGPFDGESSPSRLPLSVHQNHLKLRSDQLPYSVVLTPTHPQCTGQSDPVRSQEFSSGKLWNKEKVFAIMEEGSQNSNGKRIQSFDGKRSDHGCIEVRSFDSSEHRSCGQNSMMDTLNGEAKKTLKQDRISAMSEPILVHILSFLPTTDAIKTCMLSQRWLYLWTHVQSLNFTCKHFKHEPTLKFASFVDETLLFHRHCRINKFIVDFHCSYQFAPHVDMWVHFATAANVEELSLVLITGYRCMLIYYELPQHIYTNSSMTTLRLTYCDVAPNGLISWKSLKSLLIGYTKLSEDVIQKILVGAPLLESLEFYGCRGFNRLDIGSASLRKLVVREYWYITRAEDAFELEISAPNLQSLGIVGLMHHKKFRLMNLQSLDDCNLNFEQEADDEYYCDEFQEYQNLVVELLDSLRHVKKLTMGSWCLQLLTILKWRGGLLPVSECKCLILDSFKICDVFGIAGLLQSFLNLETLVINMASPYGLTYLYEYEFDENFPEDYWTLESQSSKYSLLHLRTVKIVGFVPECHELGLVIPFVQFLLEKGKTLERIVINAGRHNRMESSPMELLQVSQKFQSLPRISPNAVVMLSY